MQKIRTDQDDMEKSYIADKEEDEKEEDMTRKLHECIRNGKIFDATTLIQNLSQETRRRLTRANKKLGLQPAIFVAIEKTNANFVEFLVNDCNADVDEKLQKTFYPASAMSPLEFAFSKYQYRIFEFLLVAGADPTGLSNDKKSIIVACHTDMSTLLPLNLLQILADRGADFNVSDEAGVTCLMHTVRNVDRCRFLVDRGVDLNAKNNKGDTALHIAAKKDCYRSVKVLVENGADPYIKNIAGYDPLHLACLKRSEEAMNYLLETVFTDVNRQIESYQLLGIGFLSYRMDKTETVNAWKWAVALSVENRIERSAATLNTPFGVAVEAISLSELDAFGRDDDFVLMQSLVLIRKIFGSYHEMFFDSLSLIAGRYLHDCLYNRWIQMTTYSLRIIRDSSLADRERWTKVEMILFNQYIRMTRLFERNVTLSLHFKVVFEFLEEVVQAVRKYNEFDEKKELVDSMFAAVVPFFLVTSENYQRFEFHRLVRCAVATIRGHRIRTVLIDALYRWMADCTPIATSPLLAAVTMLLDCGADVNERDQNDNNVVHFLYEFGASVFSLGEIAAKCVEYGIHLDARNRTGMTTSECLQKFRIRKTPPINLMCIAARGIRKNGITVRRILPKLLTDFVEMH